MMTLPAILWAALFPFWLIGERNGLAELVHATLSPGQFFASLRLESYANLTRAKWDGMLFCAALTLVFTLVMLIIALCSRKNRSLLRFSTAQVLMGLYLLFAALSAKYGSWAGQTNSAGLPVVLWGAGRYEGLVTLLCYGLIFLCMSFFSIRPNLLLNALSLAAAAYTIIVLMQYAGMDFLRLFPTGRSIITNYEFQGPLGNIDMVSSWACLLMPALLTGFTLRQRGGWLYLPGGLCLVLLTLLMRVQSGLIVLMLTLGTLALFSLRRPECRARVGGILGGSMFLFCLTRCLELPWFSGGERIRFTMSLPIFLISLALSLLPWGILRVARFPALSRRFVALLTAAVIVLGIAGVYFLPIPEGNGLWELREILHGRPQDAFGSERLGVWRMTLDLSAESPLFGTGPDTFYYAFRDYLHSTGQSLQQNFDNPHNLFLQTLVNCGLPACLLLMLAMGAAIFRALRSGGLHAALGLGALGCVIQSLFTFSICLVSPMLYCFLGLCAAAKADDPTETEMNS